MKSVKNDTNEFDNLPEISDVDKDKIIVSAKNIVKRFGKKKVLKGLDLEVYKNERIAIVGGNGAGKTTLLNILSKNDKKFVGNLKLNVEKSEISFQFQTLNYPNEFSLYKLLMMFTIKETGISLKEKIKSELESVDLLQHKNKFPSELSGGQLQKFNLLMTMATKPKLIFFDEILSGLDQPSIAALLEYIKTKVHGNATTITISHNPKEIYELCDRLILLKDGEVLIDRSIDEIGSVEELGNIMKTNIIDDDEIDYDRLMQLDKHYYSIDDSQPSITLEKIKKWYDLHDVLMGENKKGISTAFYPGDSVAIIGRNGCGKSTLSEIIAGVKKPSKGIVSVDIFDTHSKNYHKFNNAIDKYQHDESDTKMLEEIDKYEFLTKENPGKEKKYSKKIRKIEKKIQKTKKKLVKNVEEIFKDNIKFNRKPASSLVAIQFQKQFYPSMLTLRDVIVYNLQLAKINYDELYIDYLLESIGLYGSKFSTTHELSGGQRQKLNIILCLVRKPAILILDELTTGLDLLAQEKLIRLIQEFIRRENPITILVTHSIEDIEKLANRVMMIDKGNIVQDFLYDVENESTRQRAEDMLNLLDKYE